MAKTNYDAINFKNKDIDKFSSKFGNGPGDGLIANVKDMGNKLKNAPAPKFGAGDPEKGIVSQAKDAMNTIAKTPGPKGLVRFTIDDNNKLFPKDGISDTPYTVDTTGLASGKKSFPYRYGMGIPSSGEIVGNMTVDAVKKIVSKNKNK